ncbi:restriction endonuclease subunit S [Paenibacillus sp. MER 180]|uniref:restriction endonuclease subunit S n=1 Tax=Paenibacillus sp. MER 180 TaxID=2939570 RepID=UPI0020425C7F|nr:restriction endonuclease subunit S [Paenibacillus sp. MER 180]MCM3292714.1 restriction endonuclease subunit S [Paenibacillus sp. MER 180]
MGFDKTTKKLGEVTSLIARGVTPSYTEKEKTAVLNQKCIRNNHIDFNLVRYTDSEKKKISKEKYIKQYDILVNSTGVGTLGRIAQVKFVNSPTTVDSHVTIVRPGENIDPIFLGYSLFSQQKLIESMGEGSTGQTELSRIRLAEEIVLQVPSRMEQKKIGQLFSYIDDKIELNNAINKNLEEMAQILFKRWFVDFEFPNENGDPYKSSGGELEESELGLLPKGWKVRPLNEILEINPKQILKKGSNAPYVEMKSITSYYARVTEHTNREFKSGTKFINGDVLLARITPCLENGKTAYVDFLEENQIGWGSTEYIILRSRQGIPNLFAYFLARSDEFRSHAINNMTGTSGRQRVPETSVSNYQIALPVTFELFKKFGDVVQAEFELMKKNDLESHSLKHIRDTLLPKLMSGEIRVPLDQA